MEKYIVTLIIFATSCLCEKQYRSDYIYNRKMDAFYKLHIEPVTNQVAQHTCETEGGALMVPSDQRDIAFVHGMLKQFPDIANEAWIGNDGLKHDSVEEESTVPLVLDDTVTKMLSCEVITREGDIKTMSCYHRLPFVCKVGAKAAPFNSQCGVHSKGYKYYENVGSCYKIPNIPFSWNQAYDECAAEGAHLVVINSELEHEVVQNITNAAPKLNNAKYFWFFLAGFRAEKTLDGSPLVFKTIFGQTLEEAGYDQWSENEPNNSDGKENCGSIFKHDGKFNDVDCSHLYGFVCEKEVKK